MARKKTKTESQQQPQAENVNVTKAFHLDFLTPSQKLAWSMFQNHDILFLMGCPGTGKSYLAAAFGVSEILQKKKKKLVLTRPIVEAGENLGFLPGDFNEKVNPYMMPLYDCLDKLCGTEGRQKEIIKAATEVAPLAFQRGRTFDDSVFILDEAQNCTRQQIKLAITRLGKNSKMIITGDPDQSDLPGDVALNDIIPKVKGIHGIGVLYFKEQSIVRHPLIAKILAKI